MSSQGEPRSGTGLWKDEKRSPGYFPQGRRAPLATVALLAAAGLSRLFVRHLSMYVISPFVILVGLGSFWVAARMNEQRLHEERYSRGPGWWIGWLISKTSVGFARGFYVVLGVLICLLGLAALVAHATR
jgi:uncharacterized membrane protein YhaH (DUF805 family)